MQIKVYLSDGKNSTAIVEVESRLTKVKDIRNKIFLKLGVPADRQRLFYRGKELQDAHTFYDYGINHADVVQLWPRMVLVEPNTNSKGKGKSKKPSTSGTKGKSPRKASDSAKKSKTTPKSKEVATKSTTPPNALNLTTKTRITRRSLAAADWATTVAPPADSATKARPTRKSATASDQAGHSNQSEVPEKSDSNLPPKPETSKSDSELAMTAEPPRQSDPDLTMSAETPEKSESDLPTKTEMCGKSTDCDLATTAEPPKQSDSAASSETHEKSDLDLPPKPESSNDSDVAMSSETHEKYDLDLPSSAESSKTESPKKSSDSSKLPSNDEPPKKKPNLDWPPKAEKSPETDTEVESPEKSSNAELPSTVETSKESSDLATAVKSQEKPSTSGSHTQGTLSAYFKVGDTVYTRDFRSGDWESSSIIAITKRDTSSDLELQASSSSSEAGSRQEDGLVYRVERGFKKDGSPVELSVLLQDIRLGADKSLKLDELTEGMVVLANYNYKTPTKPGAWYETLITKIKRARTGSEIYGVVFGPPDAAVPEVKLVYKYDIIPLVTLKKLEDRDEDEGSEAICLGDPCSGCKGNPDKLCFECNCVECGKGDDPESQIMCEECDDAYHIGCLDPPLDEIPTEDWYCKDCKVNDDEIVKPGEQLKKSKLKAKMPSTIAAEKGIKLRDWGRGNSTMGLTKKCTIVPENHFGPIPGVEVGTCWKWRRLVSESGVHRPPVAGIHGRGPEGAYSLVLSGGYEDDEDKGTEFFYTGAGGRDLSGNKRCSVQSFDQELTQTNLALARNCAAPVNDVTGAVAKDWMKGKPVRVVRGSKLAKHSKFAPKDGLRYDGCYKVVSYQPKTGKSGFKVWQYFLRRDDPTPAPWTAAGMKHIKEHGLDHVIDDKLTEDKVEAPKTPPKGKKRKASDPTEEPAAKVAKVKAYKPDKEVLKLIDEDQVNETEWKNLAKVAEKGKIAYLDQVKEAFMCPCCQELASEPINTPCSHIVCKACLQRSYSAGVFNCPTCRTEFSKIFEFETNSTLDTILTKLFPGYNARR